ncbi:MAG: CdaR family protein [Caldimicrobium sp.]
MKREHKLKIVSFLLATTLWYFIVWGKPVDKRLEIPIVLKGNQNNNYVYELNPSSINIVITGTRSQFRSINFTTLQIELDVTKYSPGVHQIRIPIEKINLPKDIKIKELNPTYTTLVIKKISSKRVPVKIKLANAQGEKIKLLIKPNVVLLKGFWEDIKEIKEVQTEEIDFFELKTNKIVDAKIIYPESVLEVQPNKVKIIYLAR